VEQLTISARECPTTWQRATITYKVWDKLVVGSTQATLLSHKNSEQFDHVWCVMSPSQATKKALIIRTKKPKNRTTLGLVS